VTTETIEFSERRIRRAEGSIYARDYAGEDVYRLSASRLVQHVRSRRAANAGPATSKTDLTYIGVVLEMARAVGSYSVNPKVVKEARHTCRRLHLIGESNRREAGQTKRRLALPAAGRDSDG